jgi:hypothetical protein
MTSSASSHPRHALTCLKPIGSQHMKKRGIMQKKVVCKWVLFYLLSGYISSGDRQEFGGLQPDQNKTGEVIMAEKGKKDRAKREPKKKSKLDPKEKRRIKREKKQGK